MTAHELLSQLREKGVEVKTSGDDRLVIDAPKGTVTEELRSALAANKSELLRILKFEKQAVPEPLVAAREAVQERPAPARTALQPPVMAAPPVEETVEAASASGEIDQLKQELMRLRTEEEARRAEVEAARLAAEHFWPL